jgi:hypothetical protein
MHAVPLMRLAPELWDVWVETWGSRKEAEADLRVGIGGVHPNPISGPVR